MFITLYNHRLLSLFFPPFLLIILSFLCLINFSIFIFLLFLIIIIITTTTTTDGWSLGVALLERSLPPHPTWMSHVYKLGGGVDDDDDDDDNDVDYKNKLKSLFYFYFYFY